MKLNQSLSILMLVPFIYACNSAKSPVAKVGTSDTIPVQVITLKQENSQSTIAVSGQFTTDDEVMLSFKTSGLISSLNVKEGDPVKKGQLLAALNPMEINAQVQQAELASEKTQRDFARTQNLYKDSVATLEQLQNSKTAMQQAIQQLAVAKFNRQYSEIHAPKNGYILRKLANAGQYVTPGTAVLEVNGAESGQWLLRVAISDQQWATLQLNDQAKIQTSALPGQELQGKVSRKSEGVDQVSGTFTADISLTSKKPQAVAAGMFGKAVITPSEKTTSASAANNGNWQIPYEALLDGDGNTGYVFITNDNKTAHKVKVTVSSIDKNTVTISAGLEQAKALIISGSAYLTDQSNIIIKSTPTASK